MKTFHEALASGFGWELQDDGRAVLTVQADPGGDVCTIEIEPLLFGQFYVAVYDAELELIAEKVPVRPGGGGQDA